MIGIFDSGIGGLSIAKEIRKIMPATSLVYFADSGNCPYGTKSATEIQARTKKITEFLIRQGAREIVIACNTATVSAIEYLRNNFSIPLVGVVPAVKSAVQTGRKGIVILSTKRTKQEKLYQNLVNDYQGQAGIISYSAGELVEAVENLKSDEEIKKLIKKILADRELAGIDTVVLGCTHFSLIYDLFVAVARDKFVIVDSAAAVARQAKKIYHTLSPITDQGSDYYYSSGEAIKLEVAVARFLGVSSKAKKVIL